jgi:hypothetical protein
MKGSAAEVRFRPVFPRIFRTGNLTEVRFRCRVRTQDRTPANARWSSLGLEPVRTTEHNSSSQLSGFNGDSSKRFTSDSASDSASDSTSQNNTSIAELFELLNQLWTFWIVVHSQMIQLLPPYQWQFQLPCIWYVISLIYQLNHYYASSYNIFLIKVSSFSVVLVLLENDSLEDRDDSKLNDKLPFDGMLMRQYNFLSFEVRWCLCCSYSCCTLEYSQIRVFAQAMHQGGLAMGVVIKE